MRGIAGNYRNGGKGAISGAIRGWVDVDRGEVGMEELAQVVQSAP